MTLSRHDDDRTFLYVTYVKTSVSWSLIVWNLVLIQTIFVPKIFARDFQKLFCYIKTWNSSKLNLILENQHSYCFRFLIDFLILVMVASQFRYITLHYITVYYNTLHSIALHYSALHYVTLQCVTLRYITVPYITLRYITGGCGSGLIDADSSRW